MLSSFASHAQTQSYKPACPPGTELVEHRTISEESNGNLEAEVKITYTCETIQAPAPQEETCNNPNGRRKP